MNEPPPTFREASPVEERGALLDDAMGGDLRRVLLEPLPSGLGLRPRGRWRPPFALGSAFAWLISLALIVCGAVGTYWGQEEAEQERLVGLGRCITDGGRLYVDCPTGRAPGLGWLNALGMRLAGGDDVGVWVLPAQVAVLALLVMYLALRRAYGALTAGIVLLLAAIVLGLGEFEGLSASTPFYASMLELGAFSLCAGAVMQPTRFRACVPAVLGGAAWAAAALVQPTSLIAGAVVCLGALVGLCVAGAQRWRCVLVGACFVAGFAGALAAAATVLAGQNALEAAQAAILSVLRPQPLLLLDPGAALHALWVVQFPACLAFAGLVTGLAGTSRGRALSVLLAAWWLTQLLLARDLAGLQATFPPMLWLGAASVAGLVAIARGLPVQHRALFALLVLTLPVFLGRPLIAEWGTQLKAGWSHVQHLRQPETPADERDLAPGAEPARPLEPGE